MKKDNDRRSVQFRVELACLIVKLVRVIIDLLNMGINYRIAMRY